MNFELPSTYAMPIGLPKAKVMRSQPTDAEAVLWRHLRAGRLAGAKFKRQQPLGRYIVDFVCFEARLIVEVDGGQHNENAYDQARDTWLSSQGFVVRRYWNNEVLANLECVLTDILQHTTSPSPSVPPPRGGREAAAPRRSPQATNSLSPLAGERLERGGRPTQLPTHRKLDHP